MRLKPENNGLDVRIRCCRCHAVFVAARNVSLVLEMDFKCECLSCGETITPRNMNIEALDKNNCGIKLDNPYKIQASEGEDERV